MNELDRIENNKTILKERKEIYKNLSNYQSQVFFLHVEDPKTGEPVSKKFDVSHLLGALNFSIESTEARINNYKSKCIKTLAAVNDVVSSNIEKADESDNPDEMKKLFERLNDMFDNL